MNNSLYNIVSDGQAILFVDVERYKVTRVTYLIGSGACIIASTILFLIASLSCSWMLNGTGSLGFSTSLSCQN